MANVRLSNSVLPTRADRIGGQVFYRRSGQVVSRNVVRPRINLSVPQKQFVSGYSQSHQNYGGLTTSQKAEWKDEGYYSNGPAMMVHVGLGVDRGGGLPPNEILIHPVGQLEVVIDQLYFDGICLQICLHTNFPAPAPTEPIPLSVAGVLIFASRPLLAGRIPQAGDLRYIRRTFASVCPAFLDLSYLVRFGMFAHRPVLIHCKAYCHTYPWVSLDAIGRIPVTP